MHFLIRLSKFLMSRRSWAAGALAAGMIGMSAQGCSNPTLYLWHTEKLTAEFTAARGDEIKTFDDYRQLEDRLFAQLDEEIYAPTATGPAYTLVRYSRGSAADPQIRRPNWNRSFELAADTPAGGVLLLHGMSDSPYSLRALGQSLNQRGYWVIGLRLPGHGTAPSGLKYVTMEDMTAAVRLGMAHLAAKLGPRPIHIIGYSTGAPLALEFALDALEGQTAPVPASLVLISPAIGLHPAARLAKWKRRLAVMPGLGGLAWLSVEPEFDPYKYNSFATNAAEQVFRMTRSVAGRVASRARTNPDTVLPPTLAIKSAVDATVSTNALVDQLLGRLAPNRHELLLFDINRFAAKSMLLADDPAPLTDRLMKAQDLPFTLTLVTNAHPKTTAVVARRKPPFHGETADAVPLELAWPVGVISLSHVALPFPADDPLYGQRAPDNQDILFLGQMAIKGERELFKLSPNWLLRLRHNPFYPYLETRVLAWIEAANGR
jgi:alpha-beta hydrolase superfamily lysophospholipase